MTPLIEPYAGYVLAYLLVGLACQLGLYYCHIRDDLQGKLIVPYTDGSLQAAALLVLAGPLVLTGVLVYHLLGIVWDACKAWKGLFRAGSGTEELLLGAFWLYMAWLMVEALIKRNEPGLWWLVGLMATTTLFLWQSARAMQRLKEQRDEDT